MTATSYYNEIDPYAAQWLRNLIDAGQIAPGIVDERSIEDVRPSDLSGFNQCHFFAGIGVWSYALRQAGWSDDRPVWTGSCPCQPFSAAGKGTGFDDERHLWPAWHHLISKLKPATIFGEQVASKDAMPWIDLVHTDMEAMDYAFGTVPLASAGFGAPHIRERIYWMANNNKGLEGWRQSRCERSTEQSFGARGVVDGMANTKQPNHRRETNATDYVWPKADRPADWDSRCCSSPDWIVHTDSHRRESWRTPAASSRFRHTAYAASRASDEPSQTNGYWRDADWIACRDGKWRPVEPGTSALAARTPNHVGRLRAYGNAITAQVAQEFVSAAMEYA